jgi:hypothetical protein
MKNKLWIGFTLGITVMLGVAATSYDIQKGFDFTSVSGITAARLNQLVDNALVAANRGMIIFTNSPPVAGTDMVNDPRLKRFILLNSSNNPPSLHTYNTNTLVWDALGLSPSSVTSSHIVDSTIVADDIAAGAIQNSEIDTNSVSNNKLMADAVTSGKILDGTITTSDIKAATLLSANFADDSVITALIADLNVTGDKIAALSISNAHIAASFQLTSNMLGDDSVFTAAITNDAVTLDKIDVSAGSAHQALRVDSAGTAPEWVNPGILQVVSASWTNQTVCNTAVTGTVVPPYAAANQLVSLSITPKFASSRLVFNATVSGNSDNAGYAALYITKATAGNALATTVRYVAGENHTGSQSIQYVITNSSTAPTSYQLSAGMNGGTIWTNNGGAGAVGLYGDTVTSSFTITELLD